MGRKRNLLRQWYLRMDLHGHITVFVHLSAYPTETNMSPCVGACGEICGATGWRMTWCVCEDRRGFEMRSRAKIEKDGRSLKRKMSEQKKYKNRIEQAGYEGTGRQKVDRRRQGLKRSRRKGRARDIPVGRVVSGAVLLLRSLAQLS